MHRAPGVVDGGVERTSRAAVPMRGRVRAADLRAGHGHARPVHELVADDPPARHDVSGPPAVAFQRILGSTSGDREIFTHQCEKGQPRGLDFFPNLSDSCLCRGTRRRAGPVAAEGSKKSAATSRDSGSRSAGRRRRVSSPRPVRQTPPASRPPWDQRAGTPGATRRCAGRWWNRCHGKVSSSQPATDAAAGVRNRSSSDRLRGAGWVLAGLRRYGPGARRRRRCRPGPGAAGRRAESVLWSAGRRTGRTCDRAT